jgi:hypothetical protein
VSDECRYKPIMVEYCCNHWTTEYNMLLCKKTLKVLLNNVCLENNEF